MHHLERLYASVGAAGAALGLVAAASVYLCVKYTVYLLWIHGAYRRFLAAGRPPAAPGNPLIRIHREAARHAHRPAHDLRGELAFLFHKHFHHVHRAMTLLRLISVISPLLGLMGTVLGIVKVFRVIGSQAAVNPAALATGIWEALITTVMGLTVTIPVLCCYYYLRLQIGGLQVELMEYARGEREDDAP